MACDRVPLTRLTKAEALVELMEFGVRYKPEAPRTEVLAVLKSYRSQASTPSLMPRGMGRMRKADLILECEARGLAFEGLKVPELRVLLRGARAKEDNAN